MIEEQQTYLDLLSDKEEKCRVAESAEGLVYMTVDGESRLLVFENPLSKTLTGIALDQYQYVAAALDEELLQRWLALDMGKKQETMMWALADDLSRVVNGSGAPLSRAAEAMLKLPGRTEGGAQTTQRRYLAWLTAGITTACVQALLLAGIEPTAIWNNVNNSSEVIAVARLAAMWRWLYCSPFREGKQIRVENEADRTARLFANLLSDKAIDLLVSIVSVEQGAKTKASTPLLAQLVLDAAATAAGELDIGDEVALDWERQYFSGQAPLALIAVDADQVQSYVFESAKLPEMRGASLILDLLNVKDDEDEQVWGALKIEGLAEEKKIIGLPQMLADEFELPRECVIYAAGGGALLIAPLAEVDRIKCRIERLYVETTLTATATAVHLPVRLRDLAHGLETPAPDWFQTSAPKAQGEAFRLLKDNLIGSEVSGEQWRKTTLAEHLTAEMHARERCFGQLQKVLGDKLRRAKQSKETAPHFEVSTFTERCAYCLRRPSVGLSPGEERPVCRACGRKRQGRDSRSFYLRRFKAYLDRAPDEHRHYLDCIESKGKRFDKLEPPPDLEAVAEAGQSERKFIGVIYADGNNLGALLEGLPTPAAYRSFATEVRAALEHAVYSGLGALLDGYGEVKREYKKQAFPATHEHHPFEIVSIGGDDVYLFVPAEIALELALHICREFERAFNGKITLAAGVLIAHVNTPIYFSRNIVKGLLKNAKRRSKAAAPHESAIDFQVITADTAITEDIEIFRGEAYRNHYQEDLTTRPLRLAELEKLMDLALSLKGRMPKSQLYALRDVIVQGPQPRATNYYHYQKARLAAATADKVGPRAAAFAELHGFLTEGGQGWRSREEHLPFWKPHDLDSEVFWATPLIDLVEISNFVRERNKEPELQSGGKSTVADDGNSPSEIEVKEGE